MSPKNKNIDLSQNEALRKTPFTVPEGYFEQLSQNILHKTISEEAGIIDKAGQQVPFTTPPSYFNQLEKDILSKTVAKATRVVPMVQQSWFRWSAVAASLLLISLFYFSRPSFTSDRSNDLANVSDTEILEFVNPSQASFEEYIWSHASADAVLNQMIEEELSAYAEVLSTHTELSYEFEYFDY